MNSEYDPWYAWLGALVFIGLVLAAVIGHSIVSAGYVP